MKPFFLLILCSLYLLSGITKGQTDCANMGFENGTFSGWTGNYQERHLDGKSDTDPISYPGSLQTGFGQHCIMKPTDVDPIIYTLPVVAPGSQYSARLGNTAKGGDIARLRRTFTVDNTNAIFTYKYAVVLENPDDAGHDGFWAPHFRAYLLDEAGKEIQCSNYSAALNVSPDPLIRSEYTLWCGKINDPGSSSANIGCSTPMALYDTSKYYQYPVNNTCSGSGPKIQADGTIRNVQAGDKIYYYKNWTTVSVALGAHIGKKVTVVFEAADCRINGHRGYAYVDAECNSFDLTGNLSYVCPGQSKQLAGPEGFKTYTWSKPAGSTGNIVSGGNTRTVTLNQPGTYTLTVSQFTDQLATACSFPLTYKVDPQCSTYKDSICETVKGSMQATGVNLATQFGSKISGVTITSWHTGTPATNANKIATPTNYTVSNGKLYILSTSGELELTLTVNSRPNVTFSAIDSTCIGNAAIDLKALTTPIGGIFTAPSGTNVSTGNFTPIAPGSFAIQYKYTTNSGCSDSLVRPVVVNAPPTVNAGPDQDLCANMTTVTLAGSKTNATGSAWSGGAGTYNPDKNSLSAIYTPTGAEIASTAITLTLTTSGSGKCTAVTDAVKINFTPLPGPAGPITGPSPLCVGASGTYSIAAVANATSYDWTIPSGASITSGDKTTSITVNFSTIPGGLITVTPKNDCGLGAPSSINVIVKPNLTPTVTIQGPTSICAGEMANFFVFAASDSGSAPTYVWYVNAVKQSSTKTTFQNTALVNGDVIKVEMTSSEICVTTPTATSNTLTMAVVNQVTPTVSINPTTFCQGTNVTLTATPGEGGNAPGYAWTLNNNPVGTNSNSYTSSTFANGDKVKVVMTSNSGCAFPTNIAEKEVTLTVKPVPVVTPASATICSGATSNITLTTTPNIAGTTFEWPVPVSTTVTGGLSGTTAGITHQLSTTATSPQIITYIVTPTADGCIGDPVNIPVTVNPIPEVIASDGVICSGTTTSLALGSNVTTGVTYNWSGTGNGAATGTANPIAETLTNSTTAAANTSYSITATVNNCTGPAKVIRVKVKPLPVTSGMHAPVCSGAATSVVLNINITTPDAVIAYSWTGSGSSANVTGYSATGTSNPITGTLTNTGTSSETVTYSVTPTVDGCPGAATPIAVVVKPIPAAVASPQAPICGGNPINIDLTSSIAGTVFDWKVVTAGTVSAPGATGSGTPITQTLINPGPAANTATYTITPTADGCTGPAITRAVTVNPAPDASAPDQVTCDGVQFTIPVSTSGSGVTFNWTGTATTGNITGFPASGTSNSISGTPKNNDPTTGVITYAISPSANGCTGATATVKVTVYPTPVALTTNLKPILCSGESTAIEISSLTPDTKFTVMASGAGSTNLTNVNAMAITQVLTATNQTKVVYTTTPRANGCTGAPKTDTVIVHQIPSSDAGADVGFCVGDSASIGTNSNPAYTYTWTPKTDLSSSSIANPVTTAKTSTAYTVTTSLTANATCKTTDRVDVRVTAKFTVNAGPDVLTCSKDPVTLTASPAGLVSYSWSSGAATATIDVAPEDTTMYIVTATNGGCKARDTVMVNVKNVGNPTLYIPNSFTPNNDDNNDVFKVKGDGILEFEGMIFDRWGTLFYKWTEASKGWDGTLPNGEIALEDVYVYSIKVKNLCDKKFRDPRSGIITLIK